MEITHSDENCFGLWLRDILFEATKQMIPEGEEGNVAHSRGLQRQSSKICDFGSFKVLKKPSNLNYETFD